MPVHTFFKTIPLIPLHVVRRVMLLLFLSLFKTILFIVYSARRAGGLYRTPRRAVHDAAPGPALPCQYPGSIGIGQLLAY